MVKPMGTDVDRILEEKWSALSIFDRANLIQGLEITPDNKYLNGMTLDQVIHSDQDDLPAVVRGRPILAYDRESPTGFSIEEFKRVSESMYGHQERE